MAFRTTLIGALEASSLVLVDDRRVEGIHHVVDKVFLGVPTLFGLVGFTRICADAKQPILVDEHNGNSFFTDDSGITWEVEFVVGASLTRQHVAEHSPAVG